MHLKITSKSSMNFRCYHMPNDTKASVFNGEESVNTVLTFRSWVRGVGFRGGTSD